MSLLLAHQWVVIGAQAIAVPAGAFQLRVLYAHRQTLGIVIVSQIAQVRAATGAAQEALAIAL